MVYENFKHNSIDENHEKNPIEIYGSIKFASEIIVKGYARIFNINSIILRPSAVYGPFDMNYRIFQKKLDNCIKGKPLLKNSYLKINKIKVKNRAYVGKKLYLYLKNLNKKYKT